MPENIKTHEEIKISGFKNKHGVVVPFKREKIESAIKKTAKDVASSKKIEISDKNVSNVMDLILYRMNDPKDHFYVEVDEKGKRIANIDNVIELVQIGLINENMGQIAIEFMEYRKKKEMVRNSIKVKERKKQSKDVTDVSMLIVESITTKETSSWDNKKIVEHIRKNTSLPVEVAVDVAKSVEHQIIRAGLRSVSTKLIREMVNNEISERGYKDELNDLSSYVIPKDFIQNLLKSKSVENSNISNNNPEAVNLAIAELVLKQWALDSVFSTEVKKAHENGVVYLHDLGYPTRVYCSSHSIEYIKKYGLVGLLNLSTESNPAKSASVLTGHLNTFLASMQSNYAGALGIAYINIMYAPLLENMNYKQLKQVAQEMIFNGSQNAFSRGNQTLFIDFNVHSGVPSYLKEVPSIGPGGKYMLRLKDGTKVPLMDEYRKDKSSKNNLMDLYIVEEDKKRLVLKEVRDSKSGDIIYDAKIQEDLHKRDEKIVTYGDYEKISRDFAIALLEVWGEGDRKGRVFAFPKCDFHVSDETFSDKAQYEVFLKACELASKNGSTYFVFDRDAVTLSACCRLRTTISDNYFLKHPESLRFCGFQNVTINIPQAAYRASRKGDKTLNGIKKELDYAIDIAVKAHLEKKATIKEMMSSPGDVLWQIGKPSCDGKPYIDLEAATYIIGLIGVNDAVHFMMGKEMHDGDEAMDLALKIVNHLFLRVKELSKKHNIKFSLEESPAESAARKLAKIDLATFKEESKDVIKGNDDAIYYTNSVHLAPEADISLVDRIRKQSKFHSLIESGAIVHAFVGEEKPSHESIAKLVKDTLLKTQCAQLTISPEFTYCYDCYNNMRGLKDKCDKCDGTNLVHETRIVGYFSKIENWNKSKRFGELVARHNGYYSVEKSISKKEQTLVVGEKEAKCDEKSCTI